MKRFLALFLALLTLIPLFSCASSDENKTGEANETASSQKNKKNETEEDTFEYPEICNTLTLEALEAIPVAKGTMTEAELRQICLDYFYWRTSLRYRFLGKSLWGI